MSRCKRGWLTILSSILCAIISVFMGVANINAQEVSEVPIKDETVEIKELSEQGEVEKNDTTQESTESEDFTEIVNESEVQAVEVTELELLEQKQSSQEQAKTELEMEMDNSNQKNKSIDDGTNQDSENQESVNIEDVTIHGNDSTEEVASSETETDTSEESEYIKPNVKISIEPMEGWFKEIAFVSVKVEDIVNSGNFVIESVKVKIAQNGSWVDITEDMSFSVSENCSVYVKVTDQNGKTYEKNRYISCFDKTKPVLNAAINGGLLSIQAKDSESGVLAVYVNGYEFTELNNGALNIRLQQFDTGYEYFTIQATDKAGNISEVYRTKNPYYKEPSVEQKEESPLPEYATPTEPTDAEADVTDHSSENEKEFYTIQTDSEKIFYLIVDKSGDGEKVYFLTEISERDLLNVTSDNSETLPMNSVIVESALPNEIQKTEDTQEESETTEIVTQEEEKQETENPKSEKSSSAVYVLMSIVGVIAIALGYYFKVVKKKEELEEDEEDLENEVFENEDEVETDEEDFFDKEEL